MKTPHKFFRSILLSTTLLIGSTIIGQENTPLIKDSFENITSLKNYETTGESTLSISQKHHQFGDSSLQWKWDGASSFGTSKFSHLKSADSPLKYGQHFANSPTLIFSIYNEIAQDNSIKIAYDEKDVEQVSFELKLNFTGWRTIWVPFYEMQGTAPKKRDAVAYDYFSVSTVNGESKGTIYFDDIVFSQFQDDRHSYPDVHVPFIKRDIPKGKDHWMPLLRDLKRVQEVKTTVITPTEQRDLKTIEQKIDANFYVKPKKKEDYLAKATKAYNSLHLEVKETVLGLPLTFKISQVYFDKKDPNRKKTMPIQVLGGVLKKLATYHQQSNSATEKKAIAALFVNASNYFLDQGWQQGASGGTRHHIGYNVRKLTDAFYMMKNPLKEAGLLEEIGGSLRWIFNLGKILGNEKEFHANIDYLNTQSYYHLMLIFMSDNDAQKVALLKAYSNYMSITLAQDTAIGVFKVDGTSWHHGGHYPAYGLGAFNSVTPVIYTLSGTTFSISEAGHKNFKKAFLTTRLYSNSLDFGFGLAGRHPLEDNSFVSLKDNYLDMAMSGNPKGTEKIDKDVAAAYLRLWGKKDKKNSRLFHDKNKIDAEVLMGYDVLPYAATAIHRRGNWAAFIKGYSKYVWASEIYVDENRYGRYPSNGSIQLNSDKGSIKSGFKQEGWDWNRYPATTVINLPLKELEPNTPLIMFRSEESFAGAVTLNNNGVFGMILNESKGSNADGAQRSIGYAGKLKAYKSVFSFDDKLICIGTGITSIDKEHPVQTNLFQNYLVNPSMKIASSADKNITALPYNANLDTRRNWIIDAYNNGYHILSDSDIQIKRAAQESYHNKYSIKTGRMNRKGKGATITHGDFASSWIDHGMAPKGASYQYVIYPGLKKNAAKSFKKMIKRDHSYKILRADNDAHIVLDKNTNTTGYSIFKVGADFEDSILKNVSEPSLLMIQKSKKSICISAVQPDLNLLAVKDKTLRGYSHPVSLTITLKGSWKLKDAVTNVSTKQDGNNTIIRLKCQHGFSTIMNLVKL
ncbi:MAG: hypothetical protein COB98_10695 [Flavobacteriaceae bacterium]|nr:MAG: hypothetical protein COB98_10695 [Flavobacteriaceae bacterium]